MGESQIYYSGKLDSNDCRMSSERRRGNLRETANNCGFNVGISQRSTKVWALDWQ